jgi:hypothetical protein
MLMTTSARQADSQWGSSSRPSSASRRSAGSTSSLSSPITARKTPAAARASHRALRAPVPQLGECAGVGDGQRERREVGARQNRPDRSALDGQPAGPGLAADRAPAGRPSQRPRTKRSAELLSCLRGAPEELTEETLAGLRFVRNQIGDEADLAEFIESGDSGHGTGRVRITSWTWKPRPEPVLALLPPRGRAWEMTRHRAYQARLKRSLMVDVTEGCEIQSG